MSGRDTDRKHTRSAFVGRVAASMCLVIAYAPPRSSADGDGLGLARERIASFWRGFDSFECVTVETKSRGSSEPEVETRTAFAWIMDGRSYLARMREASGPADPIDDYDIREDGQRRVFVQYFKTPPKSIDTISIGPRHSDPGQYRGPGVTAFHLLMPGGRTVADILENGGVLENRGSSRSPRWTLTADLDHRRYECVLDEAHQFLPREMTIDGEASRQVARVERFEQSNGFWYPARGSRSVVVHEDGSQIDFAFSIEQAAINRSIPDARFAWRDFPAGASVQDQRDHSIKSIGGRLARLKLLNEHPTPKRPPPANEPIQAPSAPGARARWWTSLALLSTSVLTGGLGVYLRRRGL